MPSKRWGAVVALAAVLATAPGALARPGALDRSFGGDGKVVVTLPGETPQDYPQGLPFELLEGEAGKLVVGWRSTVYRFLADGRPDLQFGQRGRITLKAPDEVEFEPADIAVDSKGRILVAGTSRREGAKAEPGPPYYPGPVPSWATVTRFLPDGRRDPGFGSNGSLDTTFGQGPPASQTSYVDRSVYNYSTPAVGAGAIAVDGEDRPLIAATAVSEVELCYLGIAYPVRVFSARLSEDGALDAQSPTTPLPARNASELQTSGDGFLLQTGPAPHCGSHGNLGPPPQILPLTAQGATAGPEVSEAIMRLFHGEFAGVLGTLNMASDGHGRIVLAGLTAAGNLVAYLHPNGAVDRRFGGDGYAVVSPLRHLSIGASAVDGRGRPLLAGSSDGEMPQFQLMRMTAQGRPDPGFGVRGSRTTSFGRATEGAASAVLVDGKERVLIGGRLLNSRFPSRSGFALVRYTGGG
jgi:uncharacterized delta-60 repeat protein